MENWNPIDHRIFETVSGSQLYGTETPESDLDTRGVCIPPLKVLLNPFHGFEQKDSGFEEEDRTIFSLAKFFKLSGDGNPNIIELLFSPYGKWVFHTDEWLDILENYKYFISKKVRHTFLGYAYSQVQKAKVHRQWFLNPPKEKPTRKMFGLTDSPKVSGEQLQAMSNISITLFDKSAQDEIRRELEYRSQKKLWDDYISWLTARNPKRKALEEKYGYDTKCVSHVFRLLEEGKQLLIDGYITFPLHNAEELLEIRNGKYTYDEALEKADNLQGKFDEFEKASSLPYSPNWKEIEELYFRLIYKKTM